MSIYFIFLVFLFGASLGSFLNCMAWRIYHNEGLWGRSHCPQCHKLIVWFDNIPIFSWLNLRAKCRQCRSAIPSQYFWTEMIAGLLFLFAFLYRFDFAPEQFIRMIGLGPIDWHLVLTVLRDWALIATLFVIFIMDLKWFVVADGVSLLGSALMLAFGLALGVSWQSLALGGLSGAGFFLVFHFASRGAWMGAGDILIGLLMGLALGWPGILVALFFSVMIAAFWGLGLILAGRKKFQWARLFKMGEPTDEEIQESALPFGTFLALGTMIALYFGQPALNWYLGLMF